MPEQNTSPESVQPVPGWSVGRSSEGAFEDCCLVIATYRRPLEVMRLLNVLAAFPEGPAEVVVVDGASTDQFSDDLRAWAHARRLPFDLIYARSRSGLTRQRNVGIDLSSRRYVFFMDDDAEPLPGYFALMRRVFEEDRDRRIGAIAGCVANEMNKPTVRRWKLRFALGLVPRLEPMIYHPSGTHTPRSLMKPFTGVRRVDVFPGCTFTLRREAVEEHRFSEFFDGYSQGEDLEMSLRVGSNWEVVCCGDAQILHNPAPGGRPAGFVRGQMEIRNRIFIWKRHTPRPRLLDRFRFWADNVLLFTMDLAWFAVRPWHFYAAAHAAGLVVGMAKCIVSPPRDKEPVARRQYTLEMAAEEVSA